MLQRVLLRHHYDKETHNFREKMDLFGPKVRLYPENVMRQESIPLSN